MNTKDVLYELRTKNGLSQDELAEKVFVTRQAVSRWETGETVPNTETLKLLSRLFRVSINTLLGSPHALYCQWCYADGTYTYRDMDELIDVCARNMVNESFSEEQARAYLKQRLPQLDYWKHCRELSDNGQYEAFKKQLAEEINNLRVPGMPKVDRLIPLVGQHVNLAYPLPNGASVRFLDDQTTYLGCQLESEFGGERHFGVLAGMGFLLVCTYEEDGKNPELVVYKKR